MFGLPTPATPAIAEWNPDRRAYRAGEVTTYDGCVYQAVRGHTSFIGGEPPAAPSLWQKVDPPPPAARAPTPPRKPRVAIQPAGADFEVAWKTRAGSAATSWRLLENGAVIHEAPLTPPAGEGGQFAALRITGRPYGLYSYQVILSNDVGAARSDLAVHTIGGASRIAISGPRADEQGQALQLTIDQGETTFVLSAAGVATPRFSIISNKNPAVIRYRLAGSTLHLSGLRPGRAALKIVETTSQQARFVGVRVRDEAGAAPAMPGHVAIGAACDGHGPEFWRAFSENDASRRIDIGCITLDGGPFDGWRPDPAGPPGERAAAWIRECRRLGMIPFFVYANLASAAAGYGACRAALEDQAFIGAYFRDLRAFLEIVRREGGDELVGVVIEPALIGLLMRHSNSRSPLPLDRLPAHTDGVYASGALDAASAPAFPNTVKGLIEAINYTIATYAPNAFFGWQFNLWASPGVSVGIPGSGLIRLTDSLGWAPGRVAISNEARIIADYYLNGGIASHGAGFIAIDKHLLDGAAGGSPDRPAEAAWFWNADHWANYLMFSQIMRERSGLPVILRQLPAGRLNDSQMREPASGHNFPPLNNTPGRFEDSAATFFFGDTFKPGSNVRQRYFGTNHGDDHKIIAAGEVVTWGAHMSDARDHGVIALMFGADDPAATSGIGMPPTDDYWWITKVQHYLSEPTPLEIPANLHE